MGERFIGAGGWGYFAGGLESYARAFRFVEVNAGFYRPIPETFARRWRTRVPPDFTFAVKAFRGVSHVDGLRGTAPARAAFAHDVRIAKILRAPLLILETPASLPLEAPQVAGLRDLVGLAAGGLRIGLEARAHRSGPLPNAAQKAMEDLGVLDGVDLSQSAARVAKDAARFVTFRRTGSFPAATSARGVASLDEVLRPDATFPATREALLRDHGWKVVDADEGTRVHASRFLGALSDRTFRSLEEVLAEVDESAVLVKRAPGGETASQTTLH